MATVASVTPQFVVGGVVHNVYSYVGIGFALSPAANGMGPTVHFAPSSGSGTGGYAGITEEPTDNYYSMPLASAPPYTNFLATIPNTDLTTPYTITVTWTDTTNTANTVTLTLEAINTFHVDSITWSSDGGGTLTVLASMPAAASGGPWTWCGVIEQNTTGTIATPPAPTSVSSTEERFVWHVSESEWNGFVGAFAWDADASTITWGSTWFDTVGACLRAGTRVTLADGTTRVVEALVVGDVVACPAGGTTAVTQVQAMCDVPLQACCVPPGMFGATAPLWLTPNHALYASVDAYVRGAPPLLPKLTPSCWVPPEGVKSEPALVNYYNVKLADGGVLFANGVVVVGMS